MSVDELRKSIDVAEMAYGGFWVTDKERDALRQVIAAARAYSCNGCMGSGEVLVREIKQDNAGPMGYDVITTEWGPCPDCSKFREIAGEQEL